MILYRSKTLCDANLYFSHFIRTEANGGEGDRWPMVRYTHYQPWRQRKLFRQVASNCQELEPTITREGPEGRHRNKPGPNISPSLGGGRLGWWPGQRFNILTFSICFTEQNSRQFSPICTTVLGGLLLDIKWKRWKYYKQFSCPTNRDHW